MKIRVPERSARIENVNSSSMREKPSWPARLHGQESSRVTALKMSTDPCLEFMNILWPLMTFFVVAFGERVFYLHQL